jgi:integrase
MVKGIFPDMRRSNRDLRPREHLYENEVNRMIEVCKETRHPIRNRTLILLAYRHALRATEALTLKWEDICFVNKTIVIRRMKGGKTGSHIITDKEIRYLKRLKRVIPDSQPKDFIFYSQKGGRLSIEAFQKLMESLGKKVGITFKVHPHMLRHGWGYKAINNQVGLIQMQHHMGHCNISNTAHYAALEVLSFPGLFRD